MQLYNKYKYKLETHLKVICDNNKEYTNLYSSWLLNKKTYKNILNTIQLNYPHYSLHDSSHSENIINNIEMMLGEKRIGKLSPTDTWLILNCAYLHDFGMALLHSNIEKEWESNEFKIFLNEIKNSSDKDLKKAVKYILELKDNIKDELFEITWPLKIRRYVTEIIAQYFRGKHSSITREYLNKLDDWSLDLTQNGLIHNRLIKLIGEISFLHSQNFEEVMKLDYISNGYNSDYIHPRFIAELIRLGDLLDLDNGRFSDYIEKVIGGLPNMSENHKDKHKATSHILITPDKIEVRSNCSNYEVYREARNWITWIENEIENITINWTEIIPKNLEWYAPKLTKKELLINGEPDINSITDLKFKISQKKAFEIIEGSNLYENKLTFLREFVQNALDASKLQLWRDLKNELYEPWIKKDISKLTPFDIPKEIYENYKLYIYLKIKDNKHVSVIIKDRGTGISLDSLKSMCNVGSNYDIKSKLQNEILDMPSWLMPTGGFGIGMQSGFLVADKFEAYTKTVGMDALKIEFEPATLDGYISVRSSEENVKKGTEIHICLDELSNFKYSLGGSVDNFINNDYDPIANDNLTFYALIDFIQENINNTIFPIEIDIDGRIERIENFIENNDFKFEDETSDYLYHIPKDLSKIFLWNKEDSVYMEISINMPYLNRTNCDVYFKGCRLSKERVHGLDGFDIYIDIYGFNTKETLKIDRTGLTKLGKDKLKKVIEKSIEFYLEKLKLKLDSLIENDNIQSVRENINLDVFKFIILSSKYRENFDVTYYKDLLSEDEFKFKILSKKEDEFNIEMISFKDIINEYPNLTYINISDFETYINSKKECDYELVKNEFNKNIDKIKDNRIIIDEEFIDIINDFIINKIQYIKSDKDIFIYTNKRNGMKENVEVDDATRIHLIKQLAVKNIDNKKYLNYGENGVRCYIPAIEKYKDLAVKRCLPRIYGKHYNTYKIISPITKYDREKLCNFGNEEVFIEHIVNREDYRKLIEFTYENQVKEGLISKKEIDEVYRKLIKDYFDIMKRDNLLVDDKEKK